jgi:hypothetical protein
LRLPNLKLQRERTSAFLKYIQRRKYLLLKHTLLALYFFTALALYFFTALALYFFTALALYFLQRWRCIFYSAGVVNFTALAL